MEAICRESKREFYGVCKGRKEFSLKEWMIGLLKYLFHELALMENCLAHSLCSQSLVHCCNHCNPLFKSSVSKIADAVVYMVLIIFALNSFMSL